MKTSVDRMSCTDSELTEKRKGIESENMGDVLGRECEKEDTSTKDSCDDIIREDADGATSTSEPSDSDSEVKDEDSYSDSDEDTSWLLSSNIEDIDTNKCSCDGCKRRLDMYKKEQKNAKLLLSSWKELRSYIRNIYINSPLESGQETTAVTLEENHRIHEIIQVMRLCDPDQLFQKVEAEARTMVIESRNRQLNILKEDSEENPALAEEFITGLIEEYVKTISSALHLSPAIELLLGSLMQRFGLTWEMLNKHLYQSLVYSHPIVQNNLPSFIGQLRNMLPLKDDLYHELVHQYLAFDDEMTAVGTVWKDVEPLMLEHRSLKAKQRETQSQLQSALKAYLQHKNSQNCSDEDCNNSSSAIDDAFQNCPKCRVKLGCPCNECTVSHLMACAGLESPTKSISRSRSRSPLRGKSEENRGEGEGGEQTCECHACTAPPTDLIDCSLPLNHPCGHSGTHGEGFQLYPHIHGTTTITTNETTVPSIYSSFQVTVSNEDPSLSSVYPHLYNLHTQKTLNTDLTLINKTKTTPIRTQLMQAITANKIQPRSPSSSPPPEFHTMPNFSQQSFPTSSLVPINIPKDIPVKSAVSLTPEQLANVKKSLQQTQMQRVGVPIATSDKKNEQTKISDQILLSKIELNSKLENANTLKSAPIKGNEIGKTMLEKAPHKGNCKVSNSNSCLQPGVCGTCVKHGNGYIKTPVCSKNTDKHLAAIARLGLSPNTNPRSLLRCASGKDGDHAYSHSHKNNKGHSCHKGKSAHEAIKKVSFTNVPDGESIECDDSSSQDDTCSERSNSTTTSTQKDSKHCDCCYCEVFGHGVPSVAPVSRNYQEMRERLRLRLNMKKSAKCKTISQKPNGTITKNTSIPSSPSSSVVDNKGPEVPKDEDLESLLKFIEGNQSEKCTDAKKAAKRARQKQKRIEEKEKIEEEEAERRRVETMKKQVTISLVNSNKRSTSAKTKGSVTNTSQKVPHSNQGLGTSLNLVGLKSLVEKRDPNSAPKMVTIKRVIEPYSSEPTVTITLKGSTPDKDKVLFTLVNGSENARQEEKENTNQSKKSKKKERRRALQLEAQAMSEQCIEENEIELETECNPKRKKKKNRNKNDLLGSQIQGKLSNKTQHSTARIIHSQTNASEGIDLALNKNKSSKALNITLQNTKQNSSKSVLKTQNQNSKNETVSTHKGQSPSKTGNSSQILNQQQNTSQNFKSKPQALSVSLTKNTQPQSLNKTVMLKNQITVQKTSSSIKNTHHNAADQKSLQQNGKRSKGQQNISTSNSNNILKSSNKQEGSAQNSLKNNAKVFENSQKKTQFANAQRNEKVESNKSKKGDKINKAIKESPRLSEPLQRTIIKRESPKVVIDAPSYRLSEVLNRIAPSPPPPKEEITLENLRLPPGITITKIEGPAKKIVKSSDNPGHVSKPVPVAPPIVLSTPSLRPNPSSATAPGNVIVVDTGRLKEVMQETYQPDTSASLNKKKKKKNKSKNAVTSSDNKSMDIPLPQQPVEIIKISKNSSQNSNIGGTLMSRNQILQTPRNSTNLENQQATIIKTSDNMVTIRSPALQQAMNLQASYQNNHSDFRGMNGLIVDPRFENVPVSNGYEDDVDVYKENDIECINKKMIGLNIDNDCLTNQMRALNIKEGSRASEILAQAMAVAAANQENKKKKKKKRNGGSQREELVMDAVDSVFQPKDIDLDNGDIDDDERELEAFKRFCLQSVPSERKDKVKVNLNIKDIVLKKKSSAIGCS